MLHVFCLSCYDQILRIVIQLISIFVMDDFVFLERSSKYLFCNYAMFMSAHAFAIRFTVSLSSLSVTTLNRVLPADSGVVFRAF